MPKSERKNVEFEIHGDTLVLRVDLSKELGPSKSGKTTLIANMGEIVEGATVQVQVFKPLS